MKTKPFVLSLVLLGAFMCATEAHAQTPKGASTPRLATNIDFGEAGMSVLASFYGKGDGFAGRRTASGERMNPRAFTAAHKRLPFGTRLLLSAEGYAPVVVRVNDRGPFVKGRALDVSPAVAEALGFLRTGVGRIKMRVLPSEKTFGTERFASTP